MYLGNELVPLFRARFAVTVLESEWGACGEQGPPRDKRGPVLERAQPVRQDDLLYHVLDNLWLKSADSEELAGYINHAV